MMATLDSNPDNLQTFNSFLSVDEADKYFETRLYSTTWTGLVDNDDGTLNETKKVALIASSRFLSVYYNYYGTRTEEFQNLEFPRIGLYDHDGYNLDYYTVPEKVKQATAELALYQIENQSLVSNISSPLDSGLTEIKVSSIALKFSRDALRDGDTTDFEFPQYIHSLLVDFIESLASIGSSGTLWVQRT